MAASGGPERMDAALEAALGSLSTRLAASSRLPTPRAEESFCHTSSGEERMA
jgi:hypothetical protein